MGLCKKYFAACAAKGRAGGFLHNPRLSTFMMGCDRQKDPNCFEDETPVHEQTVPDFYIGSHEVTERVWHSVMDGHPEIRGIEFCDECPVIDVSWDAG